MRSVTTTPADAESIAIAANAEPNSSENMPVTSNTAKNQRREAETDAPPFGLPGVGPPETPAGGKSATAYVVVKKARLSAPR